MSGKPHGGKRAGAGRPRLAAETMIRKTVTLPPAIVKALEQIGQGNLSQGIRKLYESRPAE